MNLNNNKSKKIMVATIIILLVIISMATFVVIQIGPYNKNNKEDIVVDIPTGSTLNQVTDVLKENKLIKNKILFKLYVRLSNNSSKLKSGTYLFNQTFSNKEIINDLVKGKFSSKIGLSLPFSFPVSITFTLSLDNFSVLKLASKESDVDILTLKTKFAFPLL